MKKKKIILNLQCCEFSILNIKFYTFIFEIELLMHFTFYRTSIFNLIYISQNNTLQFKYSTINIYPFQQSKCHHVQLFNQFQNPSIKFKILSIIPNNNCLLKTTE